MVELALYHPEFGFYERGGGAGRDGGDFLTSPEVGPLFGQVLAAALDEWWAGMGRPDPFVVVEAGAGAGTLAAAVFDAGPECSPALRYLLVERSDRLRRKQGERLRLEPAALVLGPVVGSDADPDGGPEPALGEGPLAASLSDLPAGRFQGVIFANELLDNLPFRLLEHGAGGWMEVLVSENLSEVLIPAAPDIAEEAASLAPGCGPGGRIPLEHAAVGWLRAATSRLTRGRVVVIDYAATTASMCRRPWTEWLRTHRRHGAGAHPLHDLGRQDITCEVAIDQLAAVREISADRPQAEFLTSFGIDALAGDARRQWHERAHIGDLQALKARSTVQEAAALTDRAGLGAFRVLEWEVGE